MKQKETLMIHRNNDDTLTIYNIAEEKFYNLNETATLIFDNFDLDDDKIIQLFRETYRNLNLEFQEDILKTKKKIEEYFFDENIDI